MIDPLAPEQFILSEGGLFLPKEVAFEQTNMQAQGNGGPPINPNRATRRDMIKQAKKHMRDIKKNA